MDRISSLPDSLLCHILSFLPTRSSVATSILSRRWRYLWKDLQVLDLVDEPFYLRRREEDDAEECFVDFVDDVLAQVIHIKKFRLTCCVFDRDALMSWLNSVSGPHLQELYLSLKDEHENYGLPCCVFNCTSLASLVLKDSISLAADGIYPFDLPSVHLPSLRSLELCILDADLIDKLLAGCPVLETLKVTLTWIDNRTIHMPHSLKSLTFQFDCNCRPGYVIEHLEIDTPSLEHLHVILQGCSVRILVSDFPDMVEARLDICPDDVHVGWVPQLLKALCRTKLLVLQAPTTECLLRTPAPDFPEFCCLLHLQLDFECFNSRLLMDLLHNCHNLQVLIIQTCKHVYRGYPHLYQKSPQSSGWTPPINVPNCVISHLNILEFRGYQGSTEEHAFTAYILQRGLVLKTVTIHTIVGSDQKEKDHILKELSIIPRGSSVCQLKLD